MLLGDVGTACTLSPFHFPGVMKRRPRSCMDVQASLMSLCAAMIAESSLLESPLYVLLQCSLQLSLRRHVWHSRLFAILHDLYVGTLFCHSFHMGCELSKVWRRHEAGS
jgi:hypothetical protein